ncbi:MAG: DUF3105 domain-containing protein [Cellulomonas sp.]
MSTQRKSELTEREARLAEVRSAQKKAERTRTVIAAAVVGVVLLGLAGATVAVFANERTKDANVAVAAKSPIEGVATFTGLSREHVTGKVAYAQNPPTGGDHSAVDQNCGYYSAPIVDENAVHSLEHGAVWITHDPQLPAAQLDTLRTFAAKSGFVLVSPRVGLPAPVVASAWGVQLRLTSADDPRLPVFLRTYVNGPQTPEPGASCSGGTGTPG